jgi:hypothetical protein
MTTTSPHFIPVSKVRELSDIILRRQNRNLNSTGRLPVVAVDTETDVSTGNIFLIADSEGSYLDYLNINFISIAKFLLRHEGKWVFFYNLGFDAECILKMLPADVLRGYRYSKRLYFDYAGYGVHYIDRKQFTIRRGNHSVSCYDISQFYDRKSLIVAYEENIGKAGLSPEYLAAKRDSKHFNRRSYLRHKKEVRWYCLQDCLKTEELARHWLDLSFRQFRFYPRRWVSAGYFAEKVLLNNGIGIPYFDDIPYDAQELAWKSFYGGRFELIRRGFIGECYLYDINSAYPYAFTRLPDLTRGRWISRTSVLPEAAVGFFHIAADVDAGGVKVAPFPFRTRQGRIVFPVGQFQTYVTLEEIKMVADQEAAARYKIIDSIQFVPDRDCTYPLRDFIQMQYDKRLQLIEKSDPLERAIKLVLNSIYGKTAQRANNIMGNLFNPVIAAFVTGFTRAQLYRFVKESDIEGDVVAFATDSVACRKKIAGLDSKKLGEMKLDKHSDDVIFLSNGIYCFNGKWKQRGIGYDREKKIEIEHLDTRIGQDGQLYIGVATTRVTHIRSGILYNRVKDIGMIQRYEKKIALNSDRKRLWIPTELFSLHERSLCESQPLNMDMLGEVIADSSSLDWQLEKENQYDPVSDL